MNKLFNPKTICLIGATDRPESVGLGITKNLLQSKKKVYLVNPKKEKILGKKVYEKITDIPEKIDLCIIATPAKYVIEIINQAKDKINSLIIISAGFKEIGGIGERRQEELEKIVRDNNIDLVGPNCLGIIRGSLNASFAPATPKSGSIALISQSGALIDSIIDKSLDKLYGFSFIVSLGNQAGLKIEDFLEFADKDEKTKVISLYIEGVEDGRRLFNVLQKIQKPVVILKGGKTDLGKRAVSSHTAALAGNARIYSQAFRQAGSLEVNSIEELLDVSKALAWEPKIKNGIAIITNGGGAGILTADYCNDLGIDLPDLSTGTLWNLRHKMPKTYSASNPVDIIGDADSKRYRHAINNLLKQKNINGLIVIQTLQIMTNCLENAKIVVQAKAKYPKKAIISAFLGGKITQKSIEHLEKNKIPNYSDPIRAVRAMRGLIK
jgi:acetate---CoA ligase (ADP-forming)